MPLEIADLRGPQSVTVGDQDHGRVSMSVAAVLAGIVHELFDFAGGQIFPNCTVYSAWWAGIPSLIRHRKFRVFEADWEYNTCFLYSYNRPVGCLIVSLVASATCLPRNPACDEVLPVCRPDPSRVATRHWDVRCLQARVPCAACARADQSRSQPPSSAGSACAWEARARGEQ